MRQLTNCSISDAASAENPLEEDGDLVDVAGADSAGNEGAKGSMEAMKPSGASSLGATGAGAASVSTGAPSAFDTWGANTRAREPGAP